MKRKKGWRGLAMGIALAVAASSVSTLSMSTLTLAEGLGEGEGMAPDAFVSSEGESWDDAVLTPEIAEDGGAMSLS